MGEEERAWARVPLGAEGSVLQPCFWPWVCLGGCARLLRARADQAQFTPQFTGATPLSFLHFEKSQQNPYFHKHFSGCKKLNPKPVIIAVHAILICSVRGKRVAMTLQLLSTFDP